MKTTLSAIALGAIVASASHAAFAGPTATTTQSGTGNAAYTEQTLVDPTAPADATISQVGNNNHAGDPVLQIPGILQRNITAYSAAHALISQNGNDNAAAIVQDGTSFPVNAEIVQFGISNAALTTQTVVTYSDGLLRQEGFYNVAALEQSNVADLSFQGFQSGVSNFMSVRQHNSGHGYSYVAQSGSLNAVSVDQHDSLGSFAIEQVGDLNTVTSTITGDVADFIQQTGTGNTVTTAQDGSNSSTILQSGNYNLATVSQIGSNDALIAQFGDSNQANVTQNTLGGGANSGYILQTGNGFVANLTQTGGGNSGGINQH